MLISVITELRGSLCFIGEAILKKLNTEDRKTPGRSIAAGEMN